MSARSAELLPAERPTLPRGRAGWRPVPVAASFLIHLLLVAVLVLSRAGRSDLPDAEQEEGIPVEVVVERGLAERLRPLEQIAAVAEPAEALKPSEDGNRPATALPLAGADIVEAARAAEPAPLAGAPADVPAQGAPAIAAAQAPPPAAAASTELKAPPPAAPPPPLPAAARAETVSSAPPDLALARSGDLALPGAAPPVDAPPALQARVAPPVQSAAPDPALADSRADAPVASVAALPPSTLESRPQAGAPLRPADPVPARGPEAPAAKTATLLPVTPQPQAVDPEAEVRNAISGFECARIGARLDAESGALVLSGHVRSEAERRRLLEQAAKAPGVQEVDPSNLRVVGDPYCRVLTFLDGARLKRSDDQRQDLAALGSSAQAGIARFAAGDNLALTLNAPDFDSFIYVDYFSSDGRVFHLLPAERPDNRFAAEERVVIGGGSGRGRRAVVGPPFGLDVVVAIASSEPLFLRPRPAAEGAADYLAALETGIRDLRARGFELKLEYAYFLTYTTERPASN